MEWPRGGARGVCRQVRVVGVASRGLSLYGGVSWYATDAGGLGWPAVVSAVLYGAYSYVLLVWGVDKGGGYARGVCARSTRRL